jgi:hypothetical protein
LNSAPLGSVMAPETVASWVCDHAPIEKSATNAAGNMQGRYDARFAPADAPIQLFVTWAAFDAVSVKISRPWSPGIATRIGCRGGLETKDPGLSTCDNIPVLSKLDALALTANAIASGAPEEFGNYLRRRVIGDIVRIGHRLRKGIVNLLPDQRIHFVISGTALRVGRFDRFAGKVDTPQFPDSRELSERQIRPDHGLHLTQGNPRVRGGIKARYSFWVYPSFLGLSE